MTRTIDYLEKLWTAQPENRDAIRKEIKALRAMGYVRAKSQPPHHMTPTQYDQEHNPNIYRAY